MMYVGRKRYGFGYLLSLLSVLLIGGIGRKVTPAVVLLAPLAIIICMSVTGCISVIPHTDDSSATANHT
jgi:hypothetical protein